MLFSAASALMLLATSASAYSPTQRSFAVNHFYGKGPLVEGRMDPVVSPGGTSSHVHTIQGGNAFALTMGDNTALDGSTCTSSLVRNDKSNYWTPKLYFQSANGSLHDVELFYMNVYYFFEATTDKIKAFQPGHRMVIGSPSLRTPPASGGKSIVDLADGTPQPVQWVCPRSNTNAPLYPTDSDGLHGVGIQDPGNQGAGVGFPDKNCDGYASPLRADVHFPSCYDPTQGLDAYKSNMQFPTHGNCPEGWIHTPHLFYEVYWNTPKFANEWTPGQGKQPFVLANGDPTGYSLHADFISGWDVKTLQQIIDNCDAGDAGMDKCPGLMGGLNYDSTSCNINSAINEEIFGVLDKLPGNNPVGQWGVNVAAAAPASASIVSAQPASSVASVVSSAKAAAPPGSSAVSTSAGIAAGTVIPANFAAVPTSASSSPSKLVTEALSPTQVSVEGGSNNMATNYNSKTTVVWTTVTVTGAAPAGTSTSSAPSGWTYTGCFNDVLKERVLSGITLANVGQHEVTNTKCITYCEEKGFSIAGTEYGGQCFCGNTLSGSSDADSSKCDMPCEGDSTQTCGGSLKLSVYAKSGSKRREAMANRHLNRHIRVSM